MRKLLLAAVLLLGAASARAHEPGERPTFKGKRVAATIAANKGAKAGDVLWNSGASDPLKGDFDSIFFQGITQNPDIILEASAGRPGKWGAWTRAHLESSGNGRFWASIPIAGEPGDRIRIRAVSKTGAPGAVEILSMHAADADEETGGTGVPGRGPLIKTDSLPVQTPTPAGPQEPAVLSRAAWGAKKAKKPYEPMVPVRISVHHTEAFQAFSKEDAANEMRVIQSFHQHGRGWIDIGYHFVIDGSGRIWEGRPLGVVGAHVKNKNDGNVGISLMGDFGAPHNNQPAGAQVKSLVALMRWLTVKYNIPVARIKGHRDQEDTSCPGDILYAQLPEIRRQVAAAPLVAAPSQPAMQALSGLFERFASGLVK